MAAAAAKMATQAKAQQTHRDGVYLLAFYRKGRHESYGSSDPRGKAAHYCGWSEDIAARLAEHRRGHGGRLPRAVVMAGYELRLVRVWWGATRRQERALKNRHRLAEMCPICAYRLEAHREEQAAATLTSSASSPSDGQSEAWRYWMNGGEW